MHDKGKLAVITGGTRGIGRALVNRFAAAGFDVEFCARTQKAVAAFQDELEGRFRGQVFHGRAVDVAVADDVEAFSAAVLEQGRTVDVLVNNAGVFQPCDVSDPNGREAFDVMMRTNVYSAYLLTLAFLPGMREARSGHIFNMCSIASIIPYGGAYSATKFALLGYSKNLREEVKLDGIRVTAVLPGAVRTSAWDGVDLPEERFMPAEDVADAVWGCHALSSRTVVEELLLRPQPGDI